MEQFLGALLVLLVLCAPSGLARLIVSWLSRQDVAADEPRNHVSVLKRSGS